MQNPSAGIIQIRLCGSSMVCSSQPVKAPRSNVSYLYPRRVIFVKLAAIRNMKTIYCDLSKKQETCPMAELLKWVQRNLRTVFFC